MAVSVQGYRNGGVPEEFLDNLWVGAFGEQECGAGVPEVVQTGFLW